MYNKFGRLRQFSQKEDKHEEIDHQSTQSIDGSLLDAAHNIRVSHFYTFFRKLLVYARVSQTRGRVTNFRGRREYTNFKQSIAYYELYAVELFKLV